MWDFLYAVECSDVVEGIDAWRETPMEAEDLVVDKGSEGKVVEKVGEVFPYVGVSIFPETLIVEAIDLGDLTRFVVTPKDGDPLGVSNFESNEEGDGLHGIVTSINVVACFQQLVLL